jgi:hypothetical protein
MATTPNTIRVGVDAEIRYAEVVRELTARNDALIAANGKLTEALTAYTHATVKLLERIQQLEAAGR